MTTPATNQLPQTILVINLGTERIEKQLFSCCVWIIFRRDVFTALLRNNGRGADHKNAVPLLLWESVHGTVV
jgi:hypothetical protein